MLLNEAIQIVDRMNLDDLLESEAEAIETVLMAAAKVNDYYEGIIPIIFDLSESTVS